jgi:hypothetical protein
MSPPKRIGRGQETRSSNRRHTCPCGGRGPRRGIAEEKRPKTDYWLPTTVKEPPNTRTTQRGLAALGRNQKRCSHKGTETQRKPVRKWAPDCRASLALVCFVPSWLCERNKYLWLKDLPSIRDLRRRTRFSQVVIRRWNRRPGMGRTEGFPQIRAARSRRVCRAHLPGWRRKSLLTRTTRPWPPRVPLICNLRADPVCPDASLANGSCAGGLCRVPPRMPLSAQPLYMYSPACE